MHVDFVFQHANDVQWTSSVIFLKKKFIITEVLCQKPVTDLGHW